MLWPSRNGGNSLASSPLPGISSLMISAPMSARSMVRKGPARTLLRSRTLIPRSASGFSMPSTTPPCPKKRWVVHIFPYTYI